MESERDTQKKQEFEGICLELRAVKKCIVDNRMIKAGEPVHTWVRVPVGTTIDDEDEIQKRIGHPLVCLGLGDVELTFGKQMERIRKNPEPGQDGFDAKSKGERIREVVATLDHETDFHWVPKGRSKRIQVPSPFVVGDRIGETVTADEVKEACPTITRRIQQE